MTHATPSLTAQRLIAHVEQMGYGLPAAQRDTADATERLPFTVRRVSTNADLDKAVNVRQAAYARHVPEFAKSLGVAEAADYDSETVVLLAESKLDGSPLGSLRIQTNRLAALHLEESVELPLWLHTKRLAEITRLGVGEGRIGRLVKMALMKAMFQYCEQIGIEYIVATGRAPIDRQYEQLMFIDVFASKAFVPLRHVGNLPHRVMAFEMATAQARWEAARHPLLAFFKHTRHPDIDLSGAALTPARHAPAVHLAPPKTLPQYGFAAA